MGSVGATMGSSGGRGVVFYRLGERCSWEKGWIHGHNSVYNATIFPHDIGLGATRTPPSSIDQKRSKPLTKSLPLLTPSTPSSPTYRDGVRANPSTSHPPFLKNSIAMQLESMRRWSSTFSAPSSMTDLVWSRRPMQFVATQGTCGDHTGVEKGDALPAETAGKVEFEVVKEEGCLLEELHVGEGVGLAWDCSQGAVDVH
ncbi:hypothetical protein FNV43_RR15501 [Rhamnella rubrinervis]|uniref:Uncharacterized protein n=1 Tax=Rhamnella rubrinervis TaxID=2594499 RepID=A0A8K0E1N4_9ROSA|nr:hypothetical protein FNV43_RR15501 [Rhamnella rubrinervis]